MLYLKRYPDLPTTTAADIETFWIVMMPFGVAGYLLYLYGKRTLAYYAFYIYCLLNILVLGHYLRAPFSTISFVITHGLAPSRNGRTGVPIKLTRAWKTSSPLCLVVAMTV